MNTSIVNLSKLLACLCVGMAVLISCATSSGSVYVPSGKNCDPQGDSDARHACNR